MSPSFYACMPESCLSLIWFLSLQNLRCSTRKQGNMEFNLLLKMQDYSPLPHPPFSSFSFVLLFTISPANILTHEKFILMLMFIFFSFLFRVVFINFLCFYLSYIVFGHVSILWILNLKFDRVFWAGSCLFWWRSVIALCGWRAFTFKL